MKHTEHKLTSFYKPFGDREVIKFFETVGEVSMGEYSKGELQFAPKNYQYIILLNS